MFEERDRKLDYLGLSLLALAIFLSLAVLSYNPADPVGDLVYPLNHVYQPDQLVYPQLERASNLCGQIGAITADVCMTAIGWGSYYILVSLFVVSGMLLFRREINAPILRSIGWALTLVGMTALLNLVLPWASRGPVIGPGGYLGAVGSGILNHHFATIGGFILASCLLLGGLLLCTDYVLLSLGVYAFGLVASRFAARSKSRLASKLSGKSNRIELSDEEDEEYEYEDEEDESVAIRISGKRVNDVDGELVGAEEEGEYEEDEYEVEEEEEDEVEYEESDEDEQPEPVKLVSKKKKTSSGAVAGSTPALRLRKPPSKDNERQEVIAQLEQASRLEETSEYALPSLDLLLEQDDFSFEEQEEEIRRKAKILEKTFEDFKFKVKVVAVETGPVIAQYEIQLEAGLRLSKITGLADDLAIALRVPSVRIVAPIPGKNTVGIEVPNESRQVVRLREVMEETNGRINKLRIPIFLGKDVSGNPVTVDLSTLPHLLIAGRTGTGKSVCLNAIIASILMTRRPDEVRMLMIDPKMVELSGYGSLPHLMHPVVTDMRKAEAILAWAVDKMEERYELLARAGVRHVSVYNQLGEDELIERLKPEDEEAEKNIPRHLPFIVIVADEMADLMMTAGKEVEQHIIRLAQKSRAVGIHLILATQKPTVDVITGLIKSNLPARIAFQVASQTDSRVVLDENGANKLLGNGDMLFLWPGTSTLVRGQGTYLSDEEINAVVDCVSTGEQQFVNELVHMKIEDADKGKANIAGKERDDLYEQAIEIVTNEGRGSLSLLQRAMGIGYGRAARMIDHMAEDGVVGSYNGSKSREVIMTFEQWKSIQNGGTGDEDGDDDPDPSPPPKPKLATHRRRSSKILPLAEFGSGTTTDTVDAVSVSKVRHDAAVDSSVAIFESEVDDLQDVEDDEEVEEEILDEEEGEVGDEVDENQDEEEEDEDEEDEVAEEDEYEEYEEEEPEEYEEEAAEYDGEEYEEEEYEYDEEAAEADAGDSEAGDTEADDDEFEEYEEEDYDGEEYETEEYEAESA